MLFLLLILPWLAANQTTFTYWYSAQQRAFLNQVLDGPKQIQPHYYVTIKGKKREYSECQLSAKAQPVGRFHDYQKIGSVSGQACQARW